MSVCDYARSILFSFKNLFRLEANINALGESDSKLTTSIEGAKTNALTLDKVDVDFSGNRENHQLTLSSNGDVDASIELQGALDKTLNWLGSLNTADINAYQQMWSVQKATALEWKNEIHRD